MRRTSIGVPLLAVILATSTSGWAENGSSRLAQAQEEQAESARPTRLEPWIGKSVPPATRRSLTGAFELAVERLRDRPECRRLFDDLGANGLEVLAQSMYYNVALPGERTTCRRTSAFTQVGWRVTRVCRSFGRLRENQAAVVLIHEALHQAGLSEKPLDPRALDSAQINQLVSDRCEL